MNEALKSLPHGPEFRFVDRVVSLQPGIEGSAEYTLPEDAPFLAGHFPGEPIMPGVLMLEAGAQFAGIVAQSDPERKAAERLRLTAIRSVKIFGAALPGETLRIRARVTGRMGELVQAAIEVGVDGKELLRGEVTLAGSDRAV
jgi:3-hydroxyacyl-[acyl-carrier-protein] dehydratase